MTDYLGGIVARSHSRVESIQPRLPSIFEPVRAIGNSTSEAIESSEFREVNSLSKPDVDTTIERPVQSVRSHDLNSLNIRNSSVIEKLNQQSTPSFKISTNENRHNTGKITGLETHPDSLYPGSSPEKSTFIVPRSTSLFSDLTRDKELSPREILEYQKTGRVESNSRVVPKVIKRLDPANQSAHGTNLSSRVIWPAVRGLGSENKTEQAQVVRVNIGRIDVRAVLAEPLKQRKTIVSTAPTLSLEDYLKQRNGGLR